VTIPGIQISGTVKGSPLVSGNLFFAFEHPLSESRVSRGRGVAQFWRELPLKAGQSRYVFFGTRSHAARSVAPRFSCLPGARARSPYRTFLHYNSWYDIGYFSIYNEADTLAAIQAFGTELVEKRGVKLDSFLFDDGWDDVKNLWHFHSGFPTVLTPLKEAAAKFGAAPGIWFSPWGGYGAPRDERLKYGKEQGFGPTRGASRYPDRSTTLCSAKRLWSLFKNTVSSVQIDGTGNVDSAFPGAAFDSDFQAAISLIHEWRTVKPDLYVNLTTGTYPSPFGFFMQTPSGVAAKTTAFSGWALGGSAGSPTGTRTRSPVW